MKRSALRWLALVAAGFALARTSAGEPVPVTFVFTSDVHYGLHRGSFRGEANVDAEVVNAAMVAQINTLPERPFPSDAGLAAGRVIGPLDFVVVTGDLTNRQELYPLKIQSASASWAQFDRSFAHQIATKNRSGGATPLQLVPGNHDVSNAIGAPTPLVPATDPTTLVQVYNRMMLPDPPRTNATFRYPEDTIHFAREFGGVHCVFITVWPDRAARSWMEEDLAQIPDDTPVFIFCHDPPEIDARHFTNPAPGHPMRAADRFENIVADVYQDGRNSDGPTTIEQRELAEFLRRHPNIRCYFHGHNNWTEFYTWSGPDHDLTLNVFRSDSPMKGKFSGKDETKLAFQVISFDRALGSLTARECLWNVDPRGAGGVRAIGWGEWKTISLAIPASSSPLP